MLTASTASPPDPAAATVPIPARRATLLVVIGMALAAHGYLALRQNVNWDELYFLSFVYDHARGTLASPLQSFHVHLFGWLTRVGGQEVNQVIAGRGVLLMLFAATCGCVYMLARRAASPEASLLAVLCCAGYSNVLYHATAFRTDGLAVALLMAALVLVGADKHRVAALAAAALLAATALLVTMKSVFFVPTLGVLLVSSRWRGWRSRRQAGEACLFALALVSAALLLYLWHATGVAGPTDQAAVGASLESTAGKVLGRGMVFPRGAHLNETVRGNAVQWMLIVWAFVVLGRRVVRGEKVPEAISLAALAVPVAAVAVYRNAFPYFYAFIMPPALVLCAIAVDDFSGRVRAGLFPYERRFQTVLAFALGAAVIVHAARIPAGMAAQRDIIRAVHEIFPEPVPYIDRNGMIASFPKVGFFMSSWGVESYRAAGQPVFARLLHARQPQFVLANTPDLSLPLLKDRRAQSGRLFPADAAVLRSNFIPYWGPVYVAGKRVRLTAGAEVTVELAVGGRYRVESEAAVTIGTSECASGAVVALAAGTVRLRSQVAQDVVLTTATARPAPDHIPPSGPMYLPFPRNGPSFPYLP